MDTCRKRLKISNTEGKIKIPASFRNETKVIKKQTKKKHKKIKLKKKISISLFLGVKFE